ncbi:hypothetical protein [Actimicrobium sp. CCI2.3]|uniref:hypothetical protein n=1 Tax=Actimicrobium sp. CCI2.3 TaxID=3048616 RepID=UPI002B23FEB4|nr:hypothetical protein [Actimicrobium sp. CCI2.3]
MQRDLQASRTTATKYLEALTADGFLQKKTIGRGNLLRQYGVKYYSCERCQVTSRIIFLKEIHK